MFSLDSVKEFFNYSHKPGRIYNLPGSSTALYLSLRETSFIAIERTEEAAARLYEDIRFFRDLLLQDNSDIVFLPEPNVPESSGKRAEIVNSAGPAISIITSVKGSDAPVWSQDTLRNSSLLFTKGENINRDAIEERLKKLGYKKVSVVVEKGEYSSKGWIFDIFPSTAETPVRIEFFGDQVEEIRFFDIETQRSVGKSDSILLLPVSEPLDGGCPLFSLINAQVFSIDLHGQELFDEKENEVRLSRFDIKGDGQNAGLLSIKGIGILPDERKSLEDMADVVKMLSKKNNILIVSPSDGQADRMKDIFMDRGIVAPMIDAGQISGYEGFIAITKGKLSAGLFMPGFLILTEREIFGERPAYRQLKKTRLSGLLASVDDIAPGDLVVHKDHGVGRFVSLKRDAIGGYEAELIVLEYKDGDRLYLPIYNIGKIGKYKAEEGVLHELDRLGGKTWQRTKNRVKKSIKEMAEKLLALYAEREVAKGFAFSTDTELHNEFYRFFPYEETPDQLKAISEISEEMESDRPMDRLLCGDVGYGKTEVAMRAAFKAVYDNRQAAVLVPTTILCEQHYITFKKRFAGFPVKIDYISRFKTKKEHDATLKALSKGEIDIIIGTHGLLRKTISFSNLGLLIVDEEHKFGVAQKERIKELKRGVDVLSMTATPIPRTLQMAISGIRGMSVIETPPEDRLAVRSVVSVFNEDIIKEALSRELDRNGQALFVHNIISNIAHMAGMVKRFFPDARVAIAHGQMPEKALESVMLKFIDGEVDVLVSTTIVGSGIDIPAANTIIINRADKIGLADLYQLKGRVGRSNVRAYAYFLIPGEDIIGDEAKKRLQAIKEMSFLGAGFRLAMKDMEIRGAGNLLGPQQSGHIHAVGFDMYLEMLEQTVGELKGIEQKEELEPSINLNISAYITEKYIEDLTIRLSIYRRISNLKTDEEIESMGTELADRFGEVPAEVLNLLGIVRLKLIARNLLLTSITESGASIRFVFSDNTPVTPQKMFGLQEKFGGVRFHKDGFGISSEKLPQWPDRISSIMSLLTWL